MTIQSKFNLNQEIWFMKDNKPTKTKIYRIQYDIFADGSGELFTYTSSDFFGGFRKTFKDGDCFETKEELLKSL